ncbi:phosphonate C-P lyase system protein PhnH [Paenibacillus sp. NPDC056579]|uniref:phosphonate C-P lyase system protein PhnH n=1 Tax=Paenibacillus sp. NPDC056579 TaxID=3345871 RepID=UPI003678065E
MANDNAVPFDPVHDTQAIYRALLNAVSRPGTVERLEASIARLQLPLGICPAAAGIASALLDGEVRFAMLMEDQEAFTAYVRRMLFSKEAAAAEADYLFADGIMPEAEIREVMGSVKRGTLVAPDDSTTLFIRVDRIESGDELQLQASGGQEQNVCLLLSGPGIRTKQACIIHGLSREWLIARGTINSEYPMGVDVFLFTETGDCMALSRTTKVKEAEPAWRM